MKPAVSTCFAEPAAKKTDTSRRGQTSRNERYVHQPGRSNTPVELPMETRQTTTSSRTRREARDMSNPRQDSTASSRIVQHRPQDPNPTSAQPAPDDTGLSRDKQSKPANAAASTRNSNRHTMSTSAADEGVSTSHDSREVVSPGHADHPSITDDAPLKQKKACVVKPKDRVMALSVALAVAKSIPTVGRANDIPKKKQPADIQTELDKKVAINVALVFTQTRPVSNGHQVHGGPSVGDPPSTSQEAVTPPPSPVADLPELATPLQVNKAADDGPSTRRKSMVTRKRPRNTVVQTPQVEQDAHVPPQSAAKVPKKRRLATYSQVTKPANTPLKASNKKLVVGKPRKQQRAPSPAPPPVASPPMTPWSSIRFFPPTVAASTVRPLMHALPTFPLHMPSEADRQALQTRHVALLDQSAALLHNAIQDFSTVSWEDDVEERTTTALSTL
ncbi:hypothetical protein DYB30_000655 [Aphanomyces astaci]|uniref:Uncharacterized protein n=2 Tax=Aphanomyces astaci TaxID=112090 RepID=A0A397E9W0_APHAT|nr:hypothetical protein DYB30_000655 [Aphanomyces astaci]RHY78872.1 hypothetical protein DYB31_009843 [Aphanomyces astaci]RHY86652.1 hypothetical protein DYB26_000307 [Aphanomyces astaci]